MQFIYVLPTKSSSNAFINVCFKSNGGNRTTLRRISGYLLHIWKIDSRKLHKKHNLRITVSLQTHWVMLPPHSSRVLGSILSLGHCQCGVTCALNVRVGFLRVLLFPSMVHGAGRVTGNSTLSCDGPYRGVYFCLVSNKCYALMWDSRIKLHKKALVMHHWLE